MGMDGYAAGGVARPGCHCKACEITNTDREHAGHGRMDGYEETGSPLHAQRTPAEWARAQEDHEAVYVMACEGSALGGPSTLTADQGSP